MLTVTNHHENSRNSEYGNKPCLLPCRTINCMKGKFWIRVCRVFTEGHIGAHTLVANCTISLTSASCASCTWYGQGCTGPTAHQILVPGFLLSPGYGFLTKFKLLKVKRGECSGSTPKHIGIRPIGQTIPWQSQRTSEIPTLSSYTLRPKKVHHPKSASEVYSKY